MQARQFLLRTQRLVAATPSSSSSSRSFSAIAARRAGKEDTLHHEGRARDVEAKKAESLREQAQGKGEWKEDLGSSSESIVCFLLFFRDLLHHL